MICICAPLSPLLHCLINPPPPPPPLLAINRCIPSPRCILSWVELTKKDFPHKNKEMTMDSNMWHAAFIYTHLMAHRWGLMDRFWMNLTDPPDRSRGCQRSFCDCITGLAACTKSFHFVWSVVHRIGILFQIFIHIFLSLLSQLPCRDFRRQVKIMLKIMWKSRVISAGKGRSLNNTRGLPPPFFRPLQSTNTQFITLCHSPAEARHYRRSPEISLKPARFLSSLCLFMI